MSDWGAFVGIEGGCISVGSLECAESAAAQGF